MPSSPKASVSYKKKDGLLTVSEDGKYLFFTPSAPPGSSPSLTVPVTSITNLQQTPETNPKVALKIVTSDESHTFSFTHKTDARKQQGNVTAILKEQISLIVAPIASGLVAKPAAKGQDADTGRPPAMAMAYALSSKPADEGYYDDSRLKADFQMQRSLLESNKQLNDRFTQALRDKPDNVTVPQFTAQFWSTRLHLLRAHAIEKGQRQGEYNVLPEIKYTVKEGEDGKPSVRTLNITKEQIKLIFKQYPVVLRAYNQSCPPMDQGQFWQRFFSSRLLKKLKGERIVRDDPPDSVLDKYIDEPETLGPGAAMRQIPLTIDLEGNEQNHSQRKGNRADVEMRENAYDQPILHVLNNLSEKMLSHMAPTGGQAHAPVGMDEATFDELQLRDLAMDDKDNRVTLNIREQRHTGTHEDDELSADARLYAKQDPFKVIASLKADIQPSRLGSDANGRLRLDKAIGYHSDDDPDSSDDEAATHDTNGNSAKPSKALRINSHTSLTSASTSIFSSISRRRDTAITSTDSQNLHGLSQQVFDTLTITHNTTTEFLHYFWTLFLSGDGSLAKIAELASTVTTLDRSLDRIKAVGDQAEVERAVKVGKLREQVKELERRTGKRRKVDESVVGGGRAVVDAMVRPTVRAL